MSKVFGVDVDVTFAHPIAFTDEWVDAIYSSLEQNMTIQSIDLSIREDESTLSFLIGVRTFIDNSPEAASELVDSAIDRAINNASAHGEREERSITRSEVLQFAA